MENSKMELTAKKIREQYAPKEENEMALERLCRLDAEVKRPAKLFAYSFGTAGSLIMGTGMCFAMDVLGKKNRIFGIVLGAAGMAMMGGNFHIYKKILAARKEQYADQIVKLSSQIVDTESTE